MLVEVADELNAEWHGEPKDTLALSNIVVEKVHGKVGKIDHVLAQLLQVH